MKPSKIDEQLVMYKCMYHPSDSLGCVCFVVGAAVVLHRSSSKRKGRSLIEQPLLWVSVQTKLMKITRWLKPTKEVTCNGTVPARDLALPGAFTPGRQGTDTCSEPVAEKTVQCKTSPPSFLSSSLLWWLSQSVTPPPPTNTHKLLFSFEALCLSLPNCWDHRHTSQCPACEVCVSACALPFRTAVLGECFVVFAQSVPNQFS